MLLRCTRHCSGACSHCSINAKPDGRHMDLDTFMRALSFIKKVQPHALMLSGGEPFDHPQIFFMLEELTKLFSPRQILVTSNGMPLQDQAFREQALSFGVGIQVVNDPRYYPHRVDIDDPRITIQRAIPAPLFPGGRALSGGLDCNEHHYAPPCNAIRCQAIMSAGSACFTDLVRMREMVGKFCTPLIDFDGSIKLGEHESCKAIGTIDTPLDQLYEQICGHRCNNCGLAYRLPEATRVLIGEYGREHLGLLQNQAA